MNLEQFFRQKALERNGETYMGVLARQNYLNNSVIDFISYLLPAGSILLDLCAGPRGSYEAALQRGYQWIGSDICTNFVRELKTSGADKVLQADCCRLPFPNASLEGVVFIFALNNITNPGHALQEASRVTKKGGIIVAADPGFSIWQTDIVLSCLVDPRTASAIIGQEKLRRIKDYFEKKEFSPQDYCDYLANLIGLKRSDLDNFISNLTDFYSDNKKRISFDFQQEVAKRYYQFVQETAKKNGLEIVKTGLIVTVGVGNEAKTDWVVFPPVEIDPNHWLDELIEARTNKKPNLLSNNLCQSSCRLILPIICFRKVK